VERSAASNTLTAGGIIEGWARRENSRAWYPTMLILAVPPPDSRIWKSDKGHVVDYMPDRRKQIMHRVPKCGLTAFGWLGDLYIANRYGEEWVRGIAPIHLILRAENS